MPTGSVVEWAECSLIIETGCRVQAFSLILYIGLSAGIQSAGDLIPETLWFRIMHSVEEDNLSPFDSKITCLCQSIETNNSKHVCINQPLPAPVTSTRLPSNRISMLTSVWSLIMWVDGKCNIRKNNRVSSVLDLIVIIRLSKSDVFGEHLSYTSHVNSKTSLFCCTMNQ